MNLNNHKKHAFYYIKNSNGEYDGLWSLSVYSFLVIVCVTLLQLVLSTIEWYYYMEVVQRLDKTVARSLKAPTSSLKDIAAWVSAFGGLCLGPVVAAYVIRRNDVGRPEESIKIEHEVKTKIDFAKLDRTPVKDDDGH